MAKEKKIINPKKWLMLFKTETGSNIWLTKGQKEIFNLVARRTPRRNLVIAYTRYGKSLSISLGLILRLISKPEKWIIVSGTQKQARVIGNYVIGHIFDNPLFYSQLEIDEPIERIKRERSKSRLTFKRGGELLILTADARNKQRTGEALMEQGASNLIIDGSGLLDDDIHATAKRMIGDNPDNFLIEIGNPFYRNHFYRDWTENNGYNKILIDYEQGIKEGRLTRAFIEEMKREPRFDIFYECKFPKVNEDVLISIEELNDLAEQETETTKTDDDIYIGVDVARSGEDNSVITIIQGNKQIEQKIIHGQDTMEIAGQVKILSEKLKPRAIGIDIVGIGAGVYDALKEQKISGIVEVNFGKEAREKERYANIRAEAYIKLIMAIKNGEIIPLKDAILFRQITNTRYAYDHQGRYKLEAKEEIKKRIGQSPDQADALAIAYWIKDGNINIKTSEISFATLN